ncbi:hypothetical protein M0R45_026540 [Rubus argutus]|uniref:Uncharacterized protein n=1 Tax=Rubus argutus TaxID=59490 RepID=A0AAW1WZJ2_RUBAR
MAKSATGGSRKRKQYSTSVSDSEIIDAANLLVQLSGSSDTTIYYDAEEESDGKTTPPTAHDDQVSSSPLKNRVIFEEEDEDEVGFGKRNRKKRFRLISDLYKPLKTVVLVFWFVSGFRNLVPFSEFQVVALVTNGWFCRHGGNYSFFAKQP